MPPEPPIVPPDAPSIAPPPAPPAPASPSDARKELWRALAIVFGATFLLAIIQWVLPFTAGFMQVGLALVLLEVPLRLVPAAERASLWLELGSVREALRRAAPIFLVVFPLFVGGFHLVYTTLLERPAEWRLDRLARWSEDLELAPSVACGRAEASAWTQESQLWLTAPANQSITVALTSDPPPAAVRITRCGKGPLPSLGGPLAPGADGRYHPPRGAGVFFDLGSARSFELHVADPSGPLPEARLRLGHRSLEADDPGLVEGSRGYLWLLAYVLIHLGLVAYPEEYFFRGYLLPRLNQRLGTPRTLLRVAVGRGLVLSALAFALLHPILIPGPHRLLVFFPALLFGWLASSQRALGAAIVVHAGSNVLLAIVSRMYG